LVRQRHYYGQGDVEAATEFTREHIEALGDSATNDQIQKSGLFHVLNSEHEEALAQFEQAWEQKTSSSTGLHAALLCDELGSDDERDEWLKRIAEKSRRKVPLRQRTIKSSESYGQCAKLLAKYVSEGEFDAKQYEKLLTVTRFNVPTTLDYFVGRFLENRDNKASEKYLQRCATSPYPRLTRMLAASHLRKQGVKIGPLRATEVENKKAPAATKKSKETKAD
jgi:hypothetical protein